MQTLNDMVSQTSGLWLHVHVLQNQVSQEETLQDQSQKDRDL